MKIVPALFGFILWFAGVAAAAGWGDLFNGRDLDGWQPQSKVDWQVTDALQVNPGRVEFRNLRIHKLGLP